MAGYFIYSLDWRKFCALVERPTPQQLMVLAKELSQVRKELEDDGEFDEGDPILKWPRSVKALTRIVAQRLALPDWYGDLSDRGKELWEGTVANSCMHSRKLGVGFHCHTDNVYFDVLILAWERLGVPMVVDQALASDVALARFGTRPFRYRPPPRRGRKGSEWYPMHSMNPPDEVQRMRAELRSVGPAIEASSDERAREQYRNELMPAIERVADAGRLLFVAVDT